MIDLKKRLGRGKKSQRDLEIDYIEDNARFIAKQETKKAKARVKLIGGGFQGSKQEYQEVVLPYWKKYGLTPEQFWFDLYCSGMASYDPRYIPDSVWYHDILPYFNYYIMRKAYRDKTMYSRLLRDVAKPETVVKNTAGYFYNGDEDKLISRAEAEELCSLEEHLIIKPSVLSGSGKDVTFFDKNRTDSESIQAIFDRFQSNFVVQRLVKQHENLARINRDSLNTIRVMTFHYKNDVIVLSTILRMGGVGSRVDNISAGGISCVIKPDGWLAEKSVTRKSEWTDQHPSGVKFREICVPSYDRIVETAKRLHLELPYFNIIGWDFAVREDGEPVFIEFNAMPEPNQISCGPTFGELTDEVLEEVFIKKTMKNIFR